MLENILKNAINSLKEEFFLNDFEIPEIKITTINAPKIDAHFCSNIFFLIRKNLKNGFEIRLIEKLRTNELIEKIEFLSGYINFTMSSKFFKNALQNLYENPMNLNVGNGEKTNVEYCSINPTGFLHIGHARNAILGDSIAKILQKLNYDVQKEYYINDAGNQINLLARSVYKKYCEKNNITCEEVENGYKGEEIAELANFVEQNDSIEKIGQKALTYFLENIKHDLELLNIFHDNWVSEKSIVESGYIEKAIEILRNKNFIEENTRESKQVKKGNISTKPLILLKTKNFGDDENRPLTKEDGSWTYFAPDIGYHLNKIERGFTYLICVLGADHDSYAKRIKIATKLLKDDIKHETPMCQMVSFENEGTLVKFSKRAGNSIRVRDFVEKIDKDILRFMILEKSANTQFVFDYEKAIEISMKNPLFYCQYAYARSCSILRNYDKAAEKLSENDIETTFEIKEFKNLILTLLEFETAIKEAGKELSSHIIINYIKKLAEKMHQMWQLGKTNEKFKVISDNKIESNARIYIILAFQKIMKESFEVLGIKPIEKME